MQEVFRLFPHMHEHAARIRDAVSRQLHDKGDRVSLEQRLLEEKAAQDGNEDADQIDPQHHHGRMLWEKGGGDHAIDRQLGAARHERGQDDGHLAVALAAQGARGHDGRHAAAKSDQHRNEALSRKADLAQRLIHDVRHTRHIAAVFQQAQKEEQDDDQRQERKHAAYARADAVDDQGMQPGRDLPCFHLHIQPADEHVDP